MRLPPSDGTKSELVARDITTLRVTFIILNSRKAIFDLFESRSSIDSDYLV